MAEIKYTDFDLLIERSGEKSYRVRVLTSSAGRAVREMTLPFTDMELENFLLKIGRPRRGVRRLESPEMESAKVFGSKLYKAIFQDELKDALRSSLDEAKENRQGLRIRLRLNDAPELVNLPWEYIYNPSLNRFLSLSVSTPIIRFLELPERIYPLEIEPPLKMLVMISSPSDYPELDVEREWNNLKSALAELEQRGLLVMDRLENASPNELQSRLRREGYHIFHFIGHGGYNEQTQDGILLMEDESGRGRPLSGQFLGTLLHDENTLRLAVLNACEGGRSGTSDPFSGVAQSLVQQGLPAVIAMQFEVTDQAAITFAREFYTAIADNYPVDASLAEARKAIFAMGNDIEWGTPVLYMRAPDGMIFDVSKTSGSDPQSVPASSVAALAQITTDTPAKAETEDVPAHAGASASDAERQIQLQDLYRQARSAMQDQQWQEALLLFSQITEIDPDYRETERMLALVQAEIDKEAVSTPQQEQASAVVSTPVAAVPEQAAKKGFPRWGFIAIAAVILLVVIGFLLFRPPPPEETPISIGIASVDSRENVTISTQNLPANEEFVVSMGAAGTEGIGGIELETIDSGSGGAQVFTFEIPELLQGSAQIDIRLQSTTSDLFAFERFFNPVAQSITITPTSTWTPTSGVGSNPSVLVRDDIQDGIVTITAQNLPADETFVVTMGAAGTEGLGGIEVASFDSRGGGTQEYSFEIPQTLRGFDQIDIRIESPTSGAHASARFFSPVVQSTTITPTPTNTPTPTSTPTDTLAGNPTLWIQDVNPDNYVTVSTLYLPANETFVVTMGSLGAQGIGIQVGIVDSGSGSEEFTFNIPEELWGSEQIPISMESQSGYIVSNWFYNQPPTSHSDSTEVTFGYFPDSPEDSMSDTYLSEADPNTNYGAEELLLIDGDDPPDTGQDKLALIRWDLSYIPSESQVLGARLSFYIENGSQRAYPIYGMLQDWGEYEATWDEYAVGANWQSPGASGSGDRGSTIVGELFADVIGPIDVELNADGIALLNTWVDDPSKNFGFMIFDSEVTNGIDFGSREASDPGKRPALTVIYIPPD